MRKRLRLIMILLFFGFVLYYPLMEQNEYRLFVINRGLIHAILASGLVFLTGFAGQISLGQAGFYAIGAYTSAILSTTYGVPIPLSVVAGVAFSILAGLLVSIPSFKLKAFFLSLVTIAFGLIVHRLIVNMQGLTGGTNGFFGIPPMRVGGAMFTSNMHYYLFLLVLAGTVVAMYHIKRSHLGRAMFAINDDEVAAESCGVSARKAKVFAFAFSGALAGLAGALYAHFAGFLTPEPFVFFESSKFVGMAVVGGLRHLWGGVIGGIGLTLLPELLRFPYAGWENYYLLFAATITILFVVFLPRGLGDLASKALNRLWKAEGKTRTLKPGTAVEDSEVGVDGSLT